MKLQWYSYLAFSFALQRHQLLKGHLPAFYTADLQVDYKAIRAAVKAIGIPSTAMSYAV